MNGQHAADPLAALIRRYAVANIGAFIAFIPLFAIILPAKAARIAGDGSLTLLSSALLAGAIMASCANIAAGWLSDRAMARWGSRRPLAVTGACLTLVSFEAIIGARTGLALVAAIIAFQFAFNLYFSPFVAMTADFVPDERKARVFGYLSAGLPMANLFVAGLTYAGLADTQDQMTAVAIAFGLLTFPLLLKWSGGAALARPVATGSPDAPAITRQDFIRAWLGRFILQFAAAVMTGYLYGYLANARTAGHFALPIDDAIGRLAAIAAVCSVSAGLLAGYLSDLFARRVPLLIATALMMAAGLAILVVATSLISITAGYTLVIGGLSAFLTVDGALVAQLVSGVRGRGYALGLMNLTNTIPSMLAPGLGLSIGVVAADQSMLDLLFGSAAASLVLGALILSRIRTIA